MSEDRLERNNTRYNWLKTARSRLRFELSGLAFAKNHGSTPEEYARYLWSTGAVNWIRNPSPGAGEYLQKEAEAFRCFYPEIHFVMVETKQGAAELAFIEGCLAGRGDDPFALARSLGLTKEDVCRYCQEAFRLWAEQLGLRAMIGHEKGKDNRCVLRVQRAASCIRP